MIYKIFENLFFIQKILNSQTFEFPPQQMISHLNLKLIEKRFYTSISKKFNIYDKKFLSTNPTEIIFDYDVECLNELLDFDKAFKNTCKNDFVGSIVLESIRDLFGKYNQPILKPFLDNNNTEKYSEILFLKSLNLATYEFYKFIYETDKVNGQTIDTNLNRSKAELIELFATQPEKKTQMTYFINRLFHFFDHKIISEKLNKENDAFKQKYRNKIDSMAKNKLLKLEKESKIWLKEFQEGTRYLVSKFLRDQNVLESCLLKIKQTEYKNKSLFEDNILIKIAEEQLKLEDIKEKFSDKNLKNDNKDFSFQYLEEYLKLENFEDKNGESKKLLKNLKKMFYERNNFYQNELFKIIKEGNKILKSVGNRFIELFKDYTIFFNTQCYSKKLLEKKDDVEYKFCFLFENFNKFYEENILNSFQDLMMNFQTINIELIENIVVRHKIYSRMAILS